MKILRAPLLAVALTTVLLLTPGCETFEDIVIYRDFHLRNMLRDDYMGKSILQPDSVGGPATRDEQGELEGAQKKRQDAKSDPPPEGLQGILQSLQELFSAPPATANSE